jgi:hypothetical protein
LAAIEDEFSRTGPTVAEMADRTCSLDKGILALVGYAIVFCSIQSLATLGLYLFARSGLETHAAAACGVFAITVAAMAVAFIPLRFAGSPWAPLATFISLLAAVICSSLGFKIGLWSLFPLAIAGVVGLAVVFINCRNLLVAHPVTLLVGAPAFALVRFIAVNGGQLTHIYAPEYMMLGQPYLDTSFHAALTEMIGNFGVVSGGLDGLVTQFHHAGTHMWIASLSQMFGIPAIAVYPIAFQIFVLPCFTCFFFYAVAFAGRARLRDPVALIVVSLAVTSIASWFMLDKLLLTESYSLALVLYLAAVPMLLLLLSRTRLSPAVLIAYAFVCALATLVLVAFKIPVGVMWGAAVTIVFVRRLTYPKWLRTFVAMAILSAVGSAVVLMVADTLIYRDLWTLISPFDFAGGSRRYFFSDLAVTALIAAGFWLSARNRAVGGLEMAGVIGMFAILGALPGSLFVLENVAYYFVNVATWFALVVLAARLSELTQKLMQLSRFAVPIAVALLVLAILADPDRYVRLSVYLQRIAALEEYGRSGEVVDWPRKRSLSQSFAMIATMGPSIAESALALGPLFPDNVSAAIDRSVGAQFVQQVRSARAKSSGRLTVFVPPDNAKFWLLSRDCRAQPFFIPAMTGVPMLMGLPPSEGALHCELDVTYGFGRYGVGSHSANLESDEICEQALIRGFDEVLVLNLPDSAIAQNPPIKCSP